MNKVLLIILIPILLIALSFNASADENNCKPIYGGGLNCIVNNKLKLDKKIQTPEGSSFVDNLSENQKFQADDTLNFELTITNTSRNSLSNIEIKDNLPKYLSYVSGPGKYNNQTRTLSFTLPKLNSKETKKFIVLAKADRTSNNYCLINRASAKYSDGETDDNSRFCIEKYEDQNSLSPNQTNQPTTKGGLPLMPAPKIGQTPATGPEMLPLIGLIPAGAIGLYLKKFKVKK